jgi:hypothetical protein
MAPWFYLRRNPADALAYAATEAQAMATTERHVRLFRNGRNQALRIPPEFERVPSLAGENWLLD